MFAGVQYWWDPETVDMTNMTPSMLKICVIHLVVTLACVSSEQFVNQNTENEYNSNDASTYNEQGMYGKTTFVHGFQYL